MAITTELPKSIYERLKPFLRTRGYACEVSDCTPPGMNTTLLHLEFSSDLSSQDCRIINAEIDRIQEELSGKHISSLYTIPCSLKQSILLVKEVKSFHFRKNKKQKGEHI